MSETETPDESTPFHIILDNGKIRVVFAEYVDHVANEKVNPILTYLDSGKEIILDGRDCKCITVEWLRALESLAAKYPDKISFTHFNSITHDVLDIIKLERLKEASK